MMTGDRHEPAVSPEGPRAAPLDPPGTPRRPTAFAELAGEVRHAVDAKLREVLDAALAESAVHGPEVVAPLEALRALALRGGKRLRPVLLAAAFEACGGERFGEAATLAGVAIELLQAYLLVHDDWMDGDEVRRGGPSVHAALRAAWRDVHGGDAGAILAGDLASALAQDVLSALPVPAERIVETMRVFARVQREVITGQLLDLRGAGPVEAMHDLKTGSYTVRGPLAIGAILAGASAEQRAALDRFAGPLGVAFQLRDDLLGTFGDESKTGKPAGSDLRAGKRTALVAEVLASGDVEGQRLLERMRHEPTDAEVGVLVAHLNATARPRVEARLKELLAQAERALAEAPIAARGRAVLEGAVQALGERET
jgi:geranylgeranyl diphosphate synthase type I